MSICIKCAEVADSNRRQFDAYGHKAAMRVHPKDCACPCQHRETREWEDYFSSPRPNEKDE